MVKRFLLQLALIISGFTGNAQLVMDQGSIARNILEELGSWDVDLLAKGGRIDAIRALNDSVAVCGARGENRGRLFISYDRGLTWKFLAQPTGSEITCIAETGNIDRFYILTGASEVFATVDRGKSWKKRAKLTVNKNRDGATASYSIMVTNKGTLLATDTDTDGGHVFRSTDNGFTWKDLGAIGKNALYRLEKSKDGVIVNEFGGAVYKSVDDGLTWKESGKLSASALFATESLDGSILLQADQAGNIYRSENAGESWERTAYLKGSADDFISLMGPVCYYSTYTESREIYVTLDQGHNWHSIGAVPTGAEGDWLDHGVSMDAGDSIVVLAGSGKGFILRKALSKKWLAEMLGGLDPKEKIKQDLSGAPARDTVRAIVKDTTPTFFRNPRAQAANAKNLVFNASFEAGADGWSTIGKRTGWGGDLWDLFGEIDPNESKHGKNSLRIELGPGKTEITYFDAWPIGRQAQNAPLAANRGWIDVIPGRQYVLSAWLRADRPGTPGLMAVYQGHDLAKDPGITREAREIRISKKWRRHDFTFTASDKQLYVAVGPDLANEDDAATVWIDAIQLEQGAAPTAFSPQGALEIGIGALPFGNIFRRAEDVFFTFSAYNRLSEKVSISVQCEATDYFDRSILREEKKLSVKANGRLDMDWPLVLPGPGHYVVKFSWRQNGTAYSRTIPMALVGAYAFDDSPFGVNHAPTTAKAGDALQQAGLKWARNWSVNWGLLEPEQGRLSFAASDEQINREQSQGFKSLVLLPPLPSTNWSSSAPDTVPATLWHRMAYMPKDPVLLMDFIRKAVAQYAHKVKHWEFLNEPVWTSFCLPGKYYNLPGANYSPDDYTGLLQQAYKTMKLADPACTVIGGFSAEPWRYTKEFIEAGGLKSVDILNIHNYGGFRAPESFIPEMDTLLAQMDRQGRRKPIWITEYTYYGADSLPWTPWKAPGNYWGASLLLKSERQCADWTVRYNAIMFARGVEKIIYHQAAEGDINHGVINLEFAFLGEEGQPRKVYAAQAALANMIGPRPVFSGPLRKAVRGGVGQPNHIQGYVFQCDEKAVAIAWTPEEEQAEVILHAPEDAEIYNIMGSRMPVSAKVKLGISPVYIVSRSRSARELTEACSIFINDDGKVNTNDKINN